MWVTKYDCRRRMKERKCLFHASSSFFLLCGAAREKPLQQGNEEKGKTLNSTDNTTWETGRQSHRSSRSDARKCWLSSGFFFFRSAISQQI